MDVGCNTYSLRGLPRCEAFAQLHELGYAAAELWAGHANYLSIGISARQVAAEASRNGIALRVYCIGGLFGLRPRVVEDRLARAFDFARKLDVGLVTGVLDRAAVRLADARAQRQGVRFALENHWYTEVARPRDVLAALDDCSPARSIAARIRISIAVNPYKVPVTSAHSTYHNVNIGNQSFQMRNLDMWIEPIDSRWRCRNMTIAR